MDTTFIQSIFDKDAHSDVTIVFDGGKRTLKAHRNILCAKSTHFKSMLDPSSKFSEAEAKLVELKGDDPKALEALFKWVYTFDYGINLDDFEKEAAELSTSVKADTIPYSSQDEDLELSPSEENENSGSVGEEHGALRQEARLLNFHMNVHIAADKYNVEDLKSVALSRFIAELQACRLALLVQKIEERLQPDRVWPEQISQLIEEQQTLKTWELVEDDGFRKLMQENGSFALTVIDQMRQTLKEWELVEHEGFRELTQADGSFALTVVDQMRSTYKRLQSSSQYKAKTVRTCNRCKNNLRCGTGNLRSFSGFGSGNCGICDHNRASYEWDYGEKQ